MLSIENRQESDMMVMSTKTEYKKREGFRMRKQLSVALSIGLAAAIGVGTLAGCSPKETQTPQEQTAQTTAKESGGEQQSQGQQAGDKLFAEPKKFSMLIPSHPSWPYQDDWYVKKLVEEETNVQLEVTAVPTDGFPDKVNLTMASGQLPDLIYFIGNTAVNQYAPQGAFVNVLDHLDQMPNFKKWYEENKDFALNYLSADGGLYQLPEKGVDETNRRGWLYRKDVFDKLGLQAPTNQEEFYEVLKALKKEYPNSYPLAFRSFSNNMAQLLMLAPSWGTDYMDFVDNRYMELNAETGTWSFGPIEDSYREMLEFYNKLYEEQLLIPNFLTIDTKGWQDVISNNEAFITVDYLSRIDFFNQPMRETNPDFNMAYMAPPAFGTEGVNGFAYSAKGILGFGISSQTKQLDDVLAYVDWLYKDETVELLSWGREGETYTVENGEKKWIGFTTAADMKKGTGFETYGFYQLYDFSGEMSTFSQETKDAVLEARKYDLPQQPVLAFNDEENQIKDTVGNTISNYVAEQTCKFILGERSFDTWDDYVSDVKGFGLDQLVKIHEDSYARVLALKGK